MRSLSTQWHAECALDDSRSTPPTSSLAHRRASTEQRSKPRLHFKALATDYDGTLADDGKVASSTIAAIRRAKRAGLKLIMVTDRPIDDLMRVCPDLDLFDTVVAENGALLYTPCPLPPRERALATPPPPELVRKLVARGVHPISAGRIIIAAWEPHQHVVLETIRDLGLELEVIFNKGAVMILPSGVNKATGLKEAAADLGIEPSEIVGVGDAENDHSLLEACGLGAAVANAVPALKKHADLILLNARGAGVVELIDQMLATDLADLRRSKNMLRSVPSAEHVPEGNASSMRLVPPRRPKRGDSNG